ncbi:hypothetical protein Bbelb_235680 [Branchiostoma belcheri]|nr:hypothetical protein Bbelb_235680 [Branchiostoma belcheri]
MGITVRNYNNTGANIITQKRAEGDKTRRCTGKKLSRTCGQARSFLPSTPVNQQMKLQRPNIPAPNQPSPYLSTGRPLRRCRAAVIVPPPAATRSARCHRPGPYRRNHATPPRRNNRASRAAAPSTRGDACASRYRQFRRPVRPANPNPGRGAEFSSLSPAAPSSSRTAGTVPPRAPGTVNLPGGDRCDPAREEQLCRPGGSCPGREDRRGPSRVTQATHGPRCLTSNLPV